MGINPNTRFVSTRKAYRVGYCLFCPNAIFSDTGHLRLTQPSIGLCHTGCKPDGAVVAKAVKAK